jgi:hypothetical protein
MFLFYPKNLHLQIIAKFKEEAEWLEVEEKRL